MIKLITQMTIQTFFLVLSQVFLKFGIQKINKLTISFETFKNMIFNYYIWFSLASLGIATFIWINVLKKNTFSTAYPLVSISYIFGLLASIFIFKETVSLNGWLGVIFIIAGIFIITRG